ncbi:hypothetical protein FDUTEX481_05539 [Tolypothrix sp. PCC 7601]|nr:hypothetical protein FDUTEX481_05539 [Tolypothrix sp. PCC 7601]
MLSWADFYQEFTVFKQLGIAINSNCFRGLYSSGNIFDCQVRWNF